MMLSRRWKDWMTVGTGLPAEPVWHFTIGWLAVCSQEFDYQVVSPKLSCGSLSVFSFPLCLCEWGCHSVCVCGVWDYTASGKNTGVAEPWIKISSYNTLSLAANSAMVLWDKTFKLWPLAGGLMIMLWVIWWHLKGKGGDRNMAYSNSSYLWRRQTEANPKANGNFNSYLNSVRQFTTALFEELKLKHQN